MAGSTGSDQNIKTGFNPNGISSEALAMLGLDKPTKGSAQAVDGLLAMGAMAVTTVKDMAAGLANAMESKSSDLETKVAKAAGTKQQGNDGITV